MIRKATNLDIPQVMIVINEAKERIRLTGSPQWQNGYPNEQVFSNDIKNDALYVYEENGIIEGVMAVYFDEPTYDFIEGQWLNDLPYAVIHRIAVSNNKKGKGVTKDLFDFVYTNFKINNIRIDTHEMNLPMINFLTRYGFSYCGIIYLNQTEDRIRRAYQKHIEKVM